METMMNSYLFSMHDKLVKLDMHIPHVVLDVLTKWHIQILPLLAAVPFLRSAMLEIWSIISARSKANMFLPMTS
jgi:hypothetical protein